MKFNEYKHFNPGKLQVLKEGKDKDIALFALGDMVDIALQLHNKLHMIGIMSLVVNLLSIKPLDLECIEKAIEETNYFITMENGAVSGGIGEFILSNISSDLRNKQLFNIGIPDKFIEHGKIDELLKKYSIDVESIFKRINEHIIIARA